MKKVILILSFFFLFIYPKGVYSQEFNQTGYYVEQFDSQINVDKNKDLFITETIRVNFNIPKHGIFRIVPTIYSNRGRTIDSRLSVNSITDEKGDKYHYEIKTLTQSKNIKIGDADKT